MKLLSAEKIMLVSKADVKQAMRLLEERVNGSGSHAHQSTTRAVLAHMRHCLWQLACNVHSLSTALEVFSLHTWPDLRRALSKSQPSSSSSSSLVSGSSSSSTSQASAKTKVSSSTSTTTASSPIVPTEELLQHTFAALLRMHDGLILITSGECRHEADRQYALRTASNSHPSRLGGGESSNSKSTHGGKNATTTNSTATVTSAAVRRDGYTRLYKSEHVYNGASWDEWHDPENGLKHRLVQATGQSWTSLMRAPPKQKQDEGSSEGRRRPSGPNVEDLVNRIESEIRRLEDDFRALRERVEHGLVPPLRDALGCAAVTVKVSFACKLERLEVRAPAARYRFECQRRGRAFQLRDRVLPPNASRDDWEKFLGFSPHRGAATKAAILPFHPVPQRPTHPPPRKKRRVIEDSDDDDVGEGDAVDTPEEQPLSTKQSGRPAPALSGAAESSASAAAIVGVDASAASFTGLVVQQRVGAPPPEPPTPSRKAAPDNGEHLQASVHQIKAALGVSAQALEASHQVLEDEEAEASREAQAIDDEYADGDDTFHENWSLQYRKLNKQLERALRQPSVDDDTLWELRDCVRQAAMAAGNQCLWSPHHPGRDDCDGGRDAQRQRRIDLENALFFFDTAQRLVQDQHDLHQLMTGKGDPSHSTSSSDDDSSLLFQRNLHLLHAQAHVNAGIAWVELYRCVRRRSSWAKRARQQFDRAERCLGIVPTLTPESSDGAAASSSSIDALLDQLKAQELRLLAVRWRGMLLWSTGDREQALDVLQAAADASVAPSLMELEHLECGEAILKVWAESYHAGVTIADLVLGALEEATVAQIREKQPQFDQLLQQAGVAVASATNKSRSLHGMVEEKASSLLSGQEFLEEFSILNETALQQSLRDSQEWWQRKVAVATKTIGPSSRDVPAGRNDLSVEGPIASDDEGDDDHRPRKNSSVVGAAPLRFVVYGSAPFPYKPRRKRVQFGGGRSNLRTTAPVPRDRRRPLQSSEPLRQYRRWGDELLPQVQDENGNWVPKLSYPAIAPEMPPDIQARLGIIQQLGRNNGPSPR